MGRSGGLEPRCPAQPSQTLSSQEAISSWEGVSRSSQAPTRISGAEKLGRLEIAFLPLSPPCGSPPPRRPSPSLPSGVGCLV